MLINKLPQSADRLRPRSREWEGPSHRLGGIAP
jgi:hypothetical protein